MLKINYFHFKRAKAAQTNRVNERFLAESWAWKLTATQRWELFRPGQIWQGHQQGASLLCTGGGQEAEACWVYTMSNKPETIIGRAFSGLGSRHSCTSSPVDRGSGGGFLGEVAPVLKSEVLPGRGRMLGEKEPEHVQGPV